MNALLIAIAILTFFTIGGLLERILPDEHSPAPVDEQAEYARAAGGRS